MDTIDLFGSTLGLGFLAGIRLYATVFLIGLVVRFHLIALPSNLAHLSVFGNSWVLATAAAACAIEFLADKIPWVDSLWDSIHTFIRPVGAALIGATVLANEDPVTRMVIALLCGGVAFSGHSTKAATRLLVNHSPEPLTNIGLSFMGDIFLPAGLWMAIKHPIITLGSIAFFMILFLWFAPSIFRSLRVECTAIVALLLKHFKSPPKVQPPTCVRCSAGRGVKGLINSVGNLCLETEYFVFTTSRMFRKRVHRISVHQVEGTRFYRGLLVDRLTLVANDYEQVFDVFKVHTVLQPEWLRSMTKARVDSPATSS